MRSNTHPTSDTTTEPTGETPAAAPLTANNNDANWERFARWHGWLGLACSLCMILLYVIVIAIANAFR